MSSTTDIHRFVVSLNFFSMFFGINPWITAKCFVPPGFLTVSRTSLAIWADSCNTKMSLLIPFLMEAISFSIDDCFEVNSFIFDSARECASLGICGNPSGITKGFELKLLITLRTLSESWVSEIIKSAVFSFPSKSYLYIVIPSNERLISAKSAVLITKRFV